jgi:hypothetical protein
VLANLKSLLEVGHALIDLSSDVAQVRRVA